MLAHEPDLVLPHFAFDRLDRVFDVADALCRPHLRRFLPDDEVRAASELLARTVLTFAFRPAVDRPPRSHRRSPTRPHLPLARPRPRCSPASGEPMSATNEELIGRADVNDLEAILASPTPTSTRPSTPCRTTPTPSSPGTTRRAPARPQPPVREGEDLAVERRDRPAVGHRGRPGGGGRGQRHGQRAAWRGHRPQRHRRSPFASWSENEWIQVGVEIQNWTLSQFMHGEQGALICTAKIVETVPWIDAKYYAPTQVMDEARHVEVFAKYLDTKLSGHYPINAHLKLLLDDIVNDSRWDMTYLGMQIMVEGLALAAFGFIHQMTTEPLLKQLLRYVMSDEARHVAFGVLSLKEYYAGLTDAELPSARSSPSRPPSGCATASSSRRCGTAWASTSRAVLPLVVNTPQRQIFQPMLFSKIVPNCKKLGLLDANGGWLRTKFTELGVIEFEDNPDTGEEY